MAVLTQSDLVYQGAFKVPTGAHGDPSHFDGFSFGGYALAYNSDSLYIAGHIDGKLVAEISIPEIVNSVNQGDLNTATVLQNFVDPCEGLLHTIYPTNPPPNPNYIGGLLVYDGKLIVSAFNYYDGTASAIASHFSRPLDLDATGSVVGAVKVGSLNPGYVGGYMCDVPAGKQAAMAGPVLTGMCGLAVVSRTSWGPGVVSFDPADIGVESPPLSATALCYYNADHPTLGTYPAQSDYWNGTMRCRGLVFPTGFDSVLFFGNHGIGPWCYGTGAACSDPAISSKGTHAYPYVYQIWHYDSADLAAVAAATANPWDFTPDIWRLDLPYSSVRADHEMGGVAYDAANQLIYWVQIRTGASNLPIIHVFEVAGTPAAEAVTLTRSLATVPAGQSNTVTWADIPDPTATDWIGLFTPGALNSQRIDWFYLNGSKTPPDDPVGASGNFGFVTPGKVRSGTYEYRLFAEDTTDVLATSSTFAVTGKKVKVRF